MEGALAQAVTASTGVCLGGWWHVCQLEGVSQAAPWTCLISPGEAFKGSVDLTLEHKAGKWNVCVSSCSSMDVS